MKQILKSCTALIAALSLAAVLAACRRAPQPTTTATAKPPATTATETTTEAPSQDNESDLLVYDFLSDAEKEVYNRLVEAIEGSEAYMEEDVAEFSAKIVDRVYFYYLLPDRPDLFYVRGNSNLYEYTGTGEELARFDIQYIYDGAQYDERMQKIESIARQIRQSLPENADDFAKAKAIYDYLIENCDYDYDYTGNSQQEAQTNASYADGALVDGKAVCSGYSRAFKLLANKLGIACMCVSNSDHEWNIVRIGGDYYHIDVTWADTEDNPGERYFCVTDEEIYKDREKPRIAVPECVVVR